MHAVRYVCSHTSKRSHISYIIFTRFVRTVWVEINYSWARESQRGRFFLSKQDQVRLVYDHLSYLRLMLMGTGMNWFFCVTRHYCRRSRNWMNLKFLAVTVGLLRWRRSHLSRTRGIRRRSQLLGFVQTKPGVVNWPYEGRRLHGALSNPPPPGDGVSVKELLSFLLAGIHHLWMGFSIVFPKVVVFYRIAKLNSKPRSSDGKSRGECA